MKTLYYKTGFERLIEEALNDINRGLFLGDNKPKRTGDCITIGVTDIKITEDNQKLINKLWPYNQPTEGTAALSLDAPSIDLGGRMIMRKLPLGTNSYGKEVGTYFRGIDMNNKDFYILDTGSDKIPSWENLDPVILKEIINNPDLYNESIDLLDHDIILSYSKLGQKDGIKRFSFKALSKQEIVPQNILGLEEKKWVFNENNKSEIYGIIKGLTLVALQYGLKEGEFY